MVKYTIVTELNVINISQNLKISLTLQIALWIYEKQVQANILVDLGAIISFIDRDFVSKYHLITSHLKYSIKVTNTNRTHRYFSYKV